MRIMLFQKTKKVLEKHTNKPIFSTTLGKSKYLVFQSNKEELRKNFGFANSDYLVGSFQRDTEGSDLISPKLVKGPDIFIEIVKNLYQKNKELKVVLTGKRRGYVISELTKNNIPFKYFEMTDFSM